MCQKEEMVKEKRIAIYGLSTETEKAIPELEKEYEIVGLLDGFRTDGVIYSYPIIPFETTLKMRITRIVVVARRGSCRAIAKKIGNFCRENEIELFDIRGQDLLQNNRVVYDFKSVKGYTFAELFNEIKAADVVSFDLFDTLVVRNTLFSSDIIEIVGTNEKQNQIDDFVKKRISFEKQMSQGGKAPRLRDIYFEVCNDNGLAEKLADEEFEIDVAVLRPRADVLRLLSQAKELGKLIFITSDTYYSFEQITRILELNNITGVDGLILSCEEDTSKTGDLFEVLKQKAGTDNILHIGDDIVADIENARTHGLKSFQIYSASELLDMVGGLGVEKYTDYLSDRIRIGMFAADVFNSPFQFEDDEKKLHIDTAAKIGYLFCAPMIMDFVQWFKKKAEDGRFSDIWFCARDGYLIKQLYELMNSKKQSNYFLTSRTSAIRAGVSSVTDIEYVDGMKFSGTIAFNLKCRFGLTSDQIENVDPKLQGLMAYSKSILEAAKIKKENNIKYISTLNLGNADVAFFDFVAKGTCQMYAQKLIPNHICGFYFLQLEMDYMKDKNLEIVPFYTYEECSTSAIFDNYYILETILTSPDSSLDEFDSNGKPVYAKETRSERDIVCVMEAQKGIMDFVKKYLSICPISQQKINKQLDEVFLQLIHYIEIRDACFLNLTVEDPFFNRMTDITDVL